MGLDQYSDEELDEIEESSASIDEQIETVLDFAVEGAGAGNGRFLLIKTGDSSRAREELLRSKGYTVVLYEDLPENPPEDYLNQIIDLLDSAQSYGETGVAEKSRIPRQQPQGKIALIFNSRAWDKLMQHKETNLAFNTNKNYMTLLGFAERPKNLE